jgi:hypothetical protein
MLSWAYGVVKKKFTKICKKIDCTQDSQKKRYCLYQPFAPAIRGNIHMPLCSGKELGDNSA